MSLREKNQTNVLSVIFTIFFRVVKSRRDKSTDLLTSCLAGLASFAHFINVDFFADLVNALHDLSFGQGG